MTRSSATVDSATFRAAMGCFLTGVTIVTSAGREGLTGLTANSFTSVSLDPCQILVCIKAKSVTGAAIRDCGRFAVNLLAAGQSDLAWRFAKPADDRFAGVAFTQNENGIPLLSGSLAHLVCELDRIHASGDHDILIGNVLACENTLVQPLAFFRGKMHDYAAA
ncbi:MAG: flavin reductase [Hyphomicrobiales bacterium]|nr:flavin reductase [Hyphomicrobiales bacterium]